MNVGVTSGGDIFGGSAVTFSDVLGDQQFNLYAGVDLAVPHAVVLVPEPGAAASTTRVQAFSQTQFFYGQLENVLYDPVYARPDRSRLRLATRTIRGGTVFGIWPFNRYRRLELFGGFMQYNEQFNDPSLDGSLAGVPGGSVRAVSSSARGNFVPLGVNFVQETTIFREFGPLSGNTVRLGYEVRAEDRRHDAVAPDRRRRRPLLPPARDLAACWRCGRAASAAGASRPTSSTSAATPRCAATSTWSSSATAPAFLNAELRFPFIEAMLTPLGVLGGIRGVLFANMGGGSFGETTDPARAGESFKWFSNKSGSLHAGHRLRPDQRIAQQAPDLRAADSRQWPAAGRRARLLRRRPRDLRARLPRALRLVVEDDC